MAIFNSFSDVLPDPVNKITDAGNLDTVAGNAGPGFASMRLRSSKDTQVSRTISGRGVARESGSHRWEIDINYHPMLRAQFDSIDAFLGSRNGRLNPFYVILPQHTKPKDATFAEFAKNTTISVNGVHNAGNSILNIDAVPDMSGTPKPSDIINIFDPANSNHQKAYKITRVETSTNYQAGTVAPTLKQFRIHINPPLERNVSDNSVIRFINPKFRVILRTDVQEYDLNTDNLYSFSLQLDEIQP